MASAADEQAPEPILVVLDDRGDDGSGRRSGADTGYALVGIYPDKGRHPVGETLGDNRNVDDFHVWEPLLWWLAD